VADSIGEPIRDAVVQLLRNSTVDGRKRTTLEQRSRTDDQGNYRIGPIPEGTYYVAVSAAPWRTAELLVQRAYAGLNPEESVSDTPAYALTYYPNTVDPRAASALELESGGEARADFSLTKGKSATVTLHVNSDKANGFFTLTGFGLAGAGGTVRMDYLANHSAVYSVSPGRYIASFTGGGSVSATKTIDVGSADVTVELTPAPPTTVAGNVLFGNKPRSLLTLLLFDEDSGGVVSREVDVQGNFSFSGVEPGAYRATLRGDDNYYISQITGEGAAINGKLIEISSGAQVKLNVTAAEDAGEVKGFALRGETPAPSVLAVLAPREESSDPYAYRASQTASDGSFDFRNIPPGDYLLFAVDKLDLEYANSEALKPYLVVGKPIRVQAQARVTERVPVQ